MKNKELLEGFEKLSKGYVWEESESHILSDKNKPSFILENTKEKEEESQKYTQNHITGTETSRLRLPSNFYSTVRQSINTEPPDKKE